MNALAESTLEEAPTGWYALATREGLRAGDVQTHVVGGRELVLYRTVSGRALAADAFCPHLGAHLGHGATVDGEALRCPMHGFRWAADGRCAGTPYGSLPRATLGTWEVRERSGVVLVWFDADGRPPDWEVPDVPTAGWSRLRLATFDLRGHPQETSENSVDLGHFSVVHGYRDVAIVEPLRTDGPRLFITYEARRPLGPTGVSARIVYRVQVHGLGFSFVEVDIPELRLRTRHYVLSTPAAPGRATLRIASAVPADGLARVLLAPWLAPIVQGRYEHDVRQDFALWEHKRYVNPPALAAGDGPIGAYRRWARQFYPSTALRDAAVAAVAGARET